MAAIHLLYYSRNPFVSIRATTNVLLLPSRKNIFKFLDHIPHQEVINGLKFFNNIDDIFNHTNDTHLSTEESLVDTKVNDMDTDMDVPNYPINESPHITKVGAESLATLSTKNDQLNSLIEKYPQLAKDRITYLQNFDPTLFNLVSMDTHITTTAQDRDAADQLNNFPELEKLKIVPPITKSDVGGDDIIHVDKREKTSESERE